MSSQEQIPITTKKPQHPAAPAYPSCPRCQRRMTLRQVAPVMFAADVDEIVYGCSECGAEAKRTVRRR